MKMTEDEEHEALMGRRVRNVGLFVVGGALILIALSSLTMKADQVNQLPRVPLRPAAADSTVVAPPDAPSESETDDAADR